MADDEKKTTTTTQKMLIVNDEHEGVGADSNEDHVENDDECGDDAEVDEESGHVSTTKKKKKKHKKKKKKSSTASANANENVNNVGSKLPPFRGVNGFTDSYIRYGQTEPPSKPVSSLFTIGSFPKGEEMEHPGDFNRFRTTCAEKRALERDNERLYDRIRYASEVHRQVRKFAQSTIKPGISLIDMCEALENKNRELVEEAGFEV